MEESAKSVITKMAVEIKSLEERSGLSLGAELFLANGLTVNHVIKTIEDFRAKHHIHQEMLDQFKIFMMTHPLDYLKMMDFISHGARISLNEIKPYEKISISAFFREHGVSEDILDFLFNAKASKGGNLNVGRGELLGALLFRDGFLMDDQSDVGVKTDHGYQVIEIKSGEDADIGEQKSLPKDSFNKISRIMSESFTKTVDSFSFAKLDPDNRSNVTFIIFDYLKPGLSREQQAKIFRDLIHYSSSYSCCGDDRIEVDESWLNLDNENGRGTVFRDFKSFAKLRDKFITRAFNVYAKSQESPMSENGLRFDKIIYISEDERDGDLKMIVVPACDEEAGAKLSNLVKFRFPSFSFNAGSKGRHHLLHIKKWA